MCRIPFRGWITLNSAISSSAVAQGSYADLSVEKKLACQVALAVFVSLYENRQVM